MKREMKKTSKIALSAVFAALSVALMALVSIIPNLELALPALTVINAAVIFTAALFIISTGIVISVKAGA